MSIRADFAARLRNDWRTHRDLRDVKVYATEGSIDAVAAPIALIRQERIGRHPDLPYSHRLVGLTLHVISRYDNPVKAGAELDTLVTAILDYLDPRFLHGDAEVSADFGHLAYTIPITLAASKEGTA